MADLNELLQEAIYQAKKLTIANHNLHSIFLCTRDSHMREFYAKADVTHIDGMPIVWIGKLLGYPLKSKHRTTYADWIWSLVEEAQRHHWKVFYLGSKPGVAEQGAKILRQKFKGLAIEVQHGYFDASRGSEESKDVVRQINAYKPHILMVGMGMPRQERWILDHSEQLQVNVILPSGAAMDYIAGAVSTPPRWTGKVGVEWLFRLVAEPKRLWSRYLIEPIFLTRLFIADVMAKLKMKAASRFFGKR